MDVTARTASAYMVRVVDMHGAPHAELVNAVVTSVTWQLGSWGGCTFTLPTLDPDAGEVVVLQRECQVWRDPLDGGPPVLLFWGPIVRARATPTTTEFQCNGLLWYFSRRYFGPNIHNLATNGGFDNGLAGWTPGGGCTASVDGGLVYSSGVSMRVTTPAQDLDAFVQTQFAVIAGPDQPVAVWVSARAYITATPATPFIGPAFEERGLYVVLQDAVTLAAVDVVWQPISNSAPRNVWFRVDAPVVGIPAGTTCNVYVRTYGVGGQINWDQVTARESESSGSNTPAAGAAVDVTYTLANVVTYAQNPAENKSDLRIAVPTAPTGVTNNRQYQFYLNGNIWDTCMNQMVTEGLCDLDVVFDAAGTSRQFAVWAQRGSYRPELALTVDGNVTDFTVDADGQATASTVRVIGQSLTNEEILTTPIDSAAINDYVGYAADVAANGGLVLEATQSASPDTTVDAVQAVAVNELARLKDLVTVVTVVATETVPGSLIGVLTVGDTVPVDVDYGWAQIHQTMRVVTLVLDPAAETLTVTLNAWRPKPGAASLSPHIVAAIGENKTSVGNVIRQVAPPPTRVSALADVAAVPAADGNMLSYDQTTGKWTPTAVAWVPGPAGPAGVAGPVGPGLPELAAAPDPAVTPAYYDTNIHRIRYWDGLTWQ